jgi:hypothetical protein
MRVFKMDELGLGYYREGSAPPAAAAVVNEEIDIDDDEDEGADPAGGSAGSRLRSGRHGCGRLGGW